MRLDALLDLRDNIPSFLYVSDGEFNDVTVLDQLLPAAGAFYAVDTVVSSTMRACTAFTGQAFSVVRARSNLKAVRRTGS